MILKNNLELRYQCLTFAKTTLVEEFKNTSKPYPTTDDILKLAKKLSDFMSDIDVKDKPTTVLRVLPPQLLPYAHVLSILQVNDKPFEKVKGQEQMFDFLTSDISETQIHFKRQCGVSTATAAWAIATCLSRYDHKICLIFESYLMRVHVYQIVMDMITRSGISYLRQLNDRYVDFSCGSSISFACRNSDLSGCLYQDIIYDIPNGVYKMHDQHKSRLSKDGRIKGITTVE